MGLYRVTFFRNRARKQGFWPRTPLPPGHGSPSQCLPGGFRSNLPDQEEETPTVFGPLEPILLRRLEGGAASFFPAYFGSFFPYRCFYRYRYLFRGSGIVASKWLISTLGGGERCTSLVHMRLLCR